MLVQQEEPVVRTGAEPEIRAGRRIASLLRSPRVWYYYEDMNDTGPSATHDSEPPSGRFVLRVDPALHGRIRHVAGKLDISLNEYCNRVLAAPGSNGVVPATEVILRADAQFGDALVGVIGYGSWARGELTDTSDIDLLVVISRKVRITRELYRVWDARPATWDLREVEPHLLHLPSEGDPISGTWAEVALEGIVLLDPSLLISRRLIEIRRRIADGEIARRMVHGQPYWIRVA